MNVVSLESPASTAPSTAGSWRWALLLSALAILSLSGCSLFSSDKDKDDKPPKHKEHSYRDPVEQRVFYDGWWQR